MTDTYKPIHTPETNEKIERLTAGYIRKFNEGFSIGNRAEIIRKKAERDFMKQETEIFTESPECPF